MMLRLGDLVRLAGVELGVFKIHCATGKNEPPLDAFFMGEFKEWQEQQTQKNFTCERVLSLIYLRGDSWLFAGVYEIRGVREGTRGEAPYVYSTSPVAGLEHLVGKAVVRFRRTFRASYLRGERWLDRLLVSEIRPDRMSVSDFPGYKSVLLSLALLKVVVQQALPAWKAPLSSVAGIYVVVDTKAGRQYVGSACGEGGIWQRWVRYAVTGHGGNKELRGLLKKKGQGYAQFFQFAVLEVLDIGASKDHVLEREAHWKAVLCSREFGYNSN